ncbi:MAG: carbon-nitrogen hydrolase [Acidobacteria bacterium]|nr:carbon-nitrogen hydrolase [Acidobacteriota bacterium]
MRAHIGLIQMACGENAGDNVAAALTHIREAARRGAQIVCLPELFKTTYFCQTEDHANFALAEEIPGPTTETLGRLAGELGIVLVASLFERRAPGLYHNTAVVIDADGAILGKYRKMHIPDDPQYHEKFYFTPGDLGFRVWHTRFGKIAVLVCWDQWYPEAARIVALQGAQIILYPTAIGWLPPEKPDFGEGQYAAWQTVQRGHAIANGIFVAAANRVGFEPSPGVGIEFWGGSFICDPRGRVQEEAGKNEEAVLVGGCDFDEVDTVRTHWPFLRDRRLDAYSDLTRRFLD